MKTRSLLILFVTILTATARAEATSFTYQGHLTSDGGPSNGTYDLRFTMYDSPDGLNSVGQSLTNSAVEVEHGLFFVQLDFGPGAFDGGARWLEVSVRTNGIPDEFTLLTPRQPVLPAPYAMHAQTASNASSAETLTGSVATSQLTGTLAAANIADQTITRSMLAEDVLEEKISFADIDGRRRAAVLMQPDGTQTVYESLVDGFESLSSGSTLLIWGTHGVEPVITTSHSSAPAAAPLKIVGLTNVVVRGIAGAEIFGEGRGDFLSIEDSHNIRIIGVTFRGNKPEVIMGLGELYSMILLRRTNSVVTVRDCTFKDFGNHGISHLWGPKTSHHVTVFNNYFENGGSIDPIDGAAISGIGSWWTVEGNSIVNVARGIEIEGASDEHPTRYVSIKGNRLNNIGKEGIMLFHTVTQEDRYSDIHIDQNLLNDIGTHGVSIAGGRRFSISQNIINGSGGGAINLQAEQAAILDGSIRGNMISAAKSGGIGIWAKTQVVRNILITENQVTMCGFDGLGISGSHVTAVNNRLWNNGNNDNRSGIRVFSAPGTPTERTILIGNHGWDDRVNGTQDYGVRIHSGITNALLLNNWFHGNATSDILDEGTGTTIIEAAPGGQEIIGNVTISGTISLGNAAKSEAPIATHTLQIKDSTGQAYRVLAVPVP